MLLAFIFGSIAKSIYFNYKDSVIIAMKMFFNRVIQTHQRKTKNSVLKTTLSIYKCSRWQLLTPSHSLGAISDPPVRSVLKWKGVQDHIEGGTGPILNNAYAAWGGGESITPLQFWTKQSHLWCDNRAATMTRLSDQSPSNQQVVYSHYTNV